MIKNKIIVFFLFVLSLILFLPKTISAQPLMGKDNSQFTIASNTSSGSNFLAVYGPQSAVGFTATNLDVNAPLDINLYSLSAEQLLNVLRHNNYLPLKNYQATDFNFISSYIISPSSYQIINQNIYSTNYSLPSLPVDQNGIYFVSFSQNGLARNLFFIKSSIATLVKNSGENDNELLFWSQSMENYQSLSAGEITTYSLQDEARILDRKQIDQNGIAELKKNALADVALVKSGDQYNIVPLSLTRFLEEKNENDLSRVVARK